MKGIGKKAVLIGAAFLVVTLLVAVAAMAAGTKARDLDRTEKRVCAEDKSCDSANCESGACKGDGECTESGQCEGGTCGQGPGKPSEDTAAGPGSGNANAGDQAGDANGDSDRQRTRDQDQTYKQEGTCTQTSQGAQPAQAGNCEMTQERACVRTEKGSDQAQGEAERTRERECLQDCDKGAE